MTKSHWMTNSIQVNKASLNTRREISDLQKATSPPAKQYGHILISSFEAN